MTLERVYLSAAENPRFRKEVVFNYGEYKSFLAAHAPELERLVSWNIKNDDLIIKAKPEAFGVAKLGDTILEVLPKFFVEDSSFPKDFISSLFNLTAGPKTGKFEGASEFIDQDDSVFDWYFFSVLSMVHSFLRKYDRHVLRSHNEQIVGVRGRLKVAESIRANKGLHHINVCEIQTTEPRARFLGIIKSMVKTLLKFSDNPNVTKAGKKCLVILKDFEEVPFSKATLLELKSKSKLLVSEHRKSATIIKSIFEIFELVDTSVGGLSHHCFSFNMNSQFEMIVELLISKSTEVNRWQLKSGNKKSLTLLNNTCQGLTINNDSSEDHENFESDSIIIKPDLFLLNENKEVFLVMDAKYKLLKYDSLNQIFSGVKSRDVQQVLSYWLHFKNKGDNAIKIALIYPHPNPDGDTPVYSQLGSITLDNPLDDTGLEIQVNAVDLLKAVKLLNEPEVTWEEQLRGVAA